MSTNIQSRFLSARLPLDAAFRRWYLAICWAHDSSSLEGRESYLPIAKMVTSPRQLPYAPTPHSYIPNSAMSATINLDEVDP
jgi:hypothetical protein